MAETDLNNEIDLKAGLRTWCEQNGVSITRFADHMGYIYQHAWSVLNGKANVTEAVIGRFVLTFGPEAVAGLLELSGWEADEICVCLEHIGDNGPCPKHRERAKV